MALTTGSSGQVVLQANFNVQKANVFGSGTSPITDLFPAINQSLSLGSGANQFNVEYCETTTVTSGTPVTVNLTSGAITASNGQTVSFADIVLLAISAPSTNTANITLGGGSNDVTSIFGATGTVTILPGATVFVAAPVATGYGVTATTACILQVSAASGTQTFNLMVAGH